MSGYEKYCISPRKYCIYLRLLRYWMFHSLNNFDPLDRLKGKRKEKKRNRKELEKK